MCIRDSWCIVQLEYESEGDSSFGIEDLDSEPRQKKQKDVSPISCLLYTSDQEGVVYKLTHDIPEKDFNIEQGGQVEIIGWLLSLIHI